MAILPYDIWHLITQYLSDEFVRCLYPINQTLFEISMNLRYQTAVVGKVDSSEPGFGRNDIKNIDDMQHSHRPTVLKIRFWELDFICRKLHVVHRRRFSCGNILIGLRDRSKIPQGVTLDEFLKTTRETVSKLTSLQKVVLEYGDCLDFPVVSYHPSLIKFICELWDIHGRRIIKMDSQLSLEDLAQIIPDFGSSLSHLQHLVIRLDIAYRTSDVDSLAATTVLPFINDVRHTLTHLDLDIFEYSMDLFLFLRGLEHLPVLESISFKSFVFTIMDHTDYEILHNFFATHKQSLKSLTLHFVRAWSDNPYVETFFARDWAHNQVPRLVFLDLHLMHLPLSQSICAYIKCFASSLASLKLSNYQYFTFEEITELLFTLHNFEYLRSLDLKILCFSPELLRLLAKQLPRLDSFSSNHRNLCREVDVALLVDDPQEWASELLDTNSNSALSTWSLRSLSFGPIRLYAPVSWEVYMKRTLTRVLPNVRWFNDLEPQAFIEVD
ncbi:hypothetical protein CPB83DRAFT_859522 [Crepidotus variabilis]|uniref:Uncharacterized protein n=1 Tax=Crepidotus variabilis TaxID=179855 RepID=A0A9P6E9U5_9AGAR|nr:hypothetical protein CPB83DRAFT_859522 [Crepidotus variabilis]